MFVVLFLPGAKSDQKLKNLSMNCLPVRAEIIDFAHLAKIGNGYVIPLAGEVVSEFK